MTILRDLSLVWSALHVLVLFIFFYESRFPRKKTIILTSVVMLPIVALNIVGVVLYGPEFMGKLIVITCTIPSAILFFTLAKKRNWQFVFTFCVVDTLSYEVLAVSCIMDYYLFGDKYIAMFVMRLLAFPALEWIAHKYLRKPYLKISASLKRGWAIFTIVAMLYYALLLVMFHYPTMVIYRSEYLPAVILVLILMPVTYIGMFLALYSQMHQVDAENRVKLLALQATALEERFAEITAMEEKIRIREHDIRHHYSVIGAMLGAGKIDDAMRYLESTAELISSDETVTYCMNPVINTVFRFFVSKANSSNIKTEIHVSFPTEMELNVTELSVVIANTFENAINANLKLPEENRYIDCRSIFYPQFMFRITNPVEGKVGFGIDGMPKTEETGHGTGIHSVVAFCEKYDIFYEFKVEDGIFIFSMLK